MYLLMQGLDAQLIAEMVGYKSIESMNAFTELLKEN